MIKWWQTFIFRLTIALRFVFPGSVFSHDIQCWFCSAFYPLPLFPTLLSSGFCLLSVCVGKFFDMAWNKNRFFFLTSHFICSVTLWALPPGLLISGYYIFIHIFLFAMLHTCTTGLQPHQKQVGNAGTCSAHPVYLAGLCFCILDITAHWMQTKPICKFPFIAVNAPEYCITKYSLGKNKRQFICCIIWWCYNSPKHINNRKIHLLLPGWLYFQLGGFEMQHLIV